MQIRLRCRCRRKQNRRIFTKVEEILTQVFNVQQHQRCRPTRAVPRVQHPALRQLCWLGEDTRSLTNSRNMNSASRTMNRRRLQRTARTRILYYTNSSVALRHQKELQNQHRGTHIQVYIHTNEVWYTDVNNSNA